MKIKRWILARFPWALRHHYHKELRYAGCSRCGHLILLGHVDNRIVSIKAWGFTWRATYSKACAPAFTHLELAPDRIAHAYQDSEGGRIELEAIPAKDQAEFDRLSTEMLEQVAHLETYDWI